MNSNADRIINARQTGDSLRAAGFTATATSGFKCRRTVTATGEVVRVRWIGADAADRIEDIAVALLTDGYTVDCVSDTELHVWATETTRLRKVTSAYHRNLMSEYTCWRDAYLAEREYVTCGYATETAEFDSTRDVPTFQKFLVGRTERAGFDLAA